MSSTRAFVDGRSADAAALARFARSSYGHFTTMQVRDGAVRGLGLHLARLEEATRVLFDTALDVAAVRVQMRQALNSQADASLRVSVGAANYTARNMESPARLEVLVLVDPPAPEMIAPMRLMSVTHSRYLPQIKHSGMFDLLHLRRRARASGFDDVVLLTPEGFVAEGATCNVGFFRGDALVWPQAPRLDGVTMRLVSHALDVTPICEKRCDAVMYRPVTLADVAGFDGGFCCNTGGIWSIRSMDDHVLPDSENAVQHLRELLAAIPPEPL